MSATAMAPVQAAIYALLSVDATLSGMADWIGDGIPEGRSEKTAVLIAQVIELPDNTFGRRGHEVQVQVESLVEDRTDRTGNLELQQMNDRVVELLDGAALSVAGHDTVLCHLQQSVAAPATGYRRIVSDFLVILEDAS